jgi:iron-sulfur-dependent L-serine dehydratase beta subunit
VAFVSIFNDVLGPVMRGPSSSHTAGAHRIGPVFRDLIDAQPTRVRVTFDPGGSMAPTWQPLGVDLAFTAGIMGWSMLDDAYTDSVERARDAGVKVIFESAPLEETDHPNGMLIEATAESGRRLRVVAEAVGGNPQQAADAAAISLQNTMGSPCDPVAGACEVPCHTRNAVAASSAFTCADLILGGYHNPIPLDESIDVSYAVGRALPSELRCTARGGCAVAPSALRLIRLR